MSGSGVDRGPSAGLTAAGNLGRAFWQRLPRVSPDDQASMLAELLPVGEALRTYVWRFGSLIVLSASIATFGLLADSSAVVIGAMLVAPLMTPIIATAASICVADNRGLLRSLLVIVGGTVLAIAVGYVLSMVAAGSAVTADDLPGEVLARTEPGLIDLGIAVSAGAAAGYVAPRRDTTAALPGVGIAVALVPPLATVGITLEAGATAEARGALLLYLTNLAAIVFSSALLLLGSGVSPPQLRSLSQMRVAFVVTVGAVVAVAIPLTVHTVEALEDNGFERSVTDAIREWDATVDVVDLVVDVDDGRGTVELRISTDVQPRPAWELADLIADRFDGPVELLLATERAEEIRVSAR